MKTHWAGILTMVLVSLCPETSVAQRRPPITYVEANRAASTAQAVIVDDCALVHTAQFLPLDRDGQLVGKEDPGRQADQVLSNLETALLEADSETQRIVKLNVYVSHVQVVTEVKTRIAKQFAE